MDIEFKCEGCVQKLTVNEAGAGMSVACPSCGHNLTVPQQNSLPAVIRVNLAGNRARMQGGDENLIRRLADYERVSGILWILLAIIQICTIVGAIAGVWNIVAGASRLSLVKRIQRRDPSVPREFEGVASLVIIGIINLILGGVIGVIVVGLDFYIRDKVLTNRHLFATPEDERMQRAKATTFSDCW